MRNMWNSRVAASGRTINSQIIRMLNHLPNRQPCQAARSFGGLAFWLAIMSAGLFAVPGAPRVQGAAPAVPTFERDIRPFVRKFCSDCHGKDSPEGKLDLESFVTGDAVSKSRGVWRKVALRVQGGEMPPKKADQPTTDERIQFTQALTAVLQNLDCGREHPVGRSRIRRLNRAEYLNTIRDLIGVDFQAAQDFPADDVANGFDNSADVLTLPPVLLEKYLHAAEQIVDQAVVTGEINDSPSMRLMARQLDSNRDVRLEEDRARALFSEGEVYGEFQVTRPGKYLIRCGAYADQAGDELAKVRLSRDGEEIAVHDVSGTVDLPGTYDAESELKIGKYRISAEFINDFYAPDDPDPDKRDRNLYVTFLELLGPLGLPPAELPKSHRELFFFEPDPSNPRDSAAKVLKNFVGKAYRRPATDEEIERLLTLFDAQSDADANFYAAIKTPLMAVLVSPKFLFRIEASSPGDHPPGVELVDEYGLATRLSYFLWGSMPDEALFSEASSKSLRTEQHLRGQVERMLADPRSRNLADQFAIQWLQLRPLETLSRDAAKFPGFDEGLRQSMREETVLFFLSVLKEDRSLFDLLDADYTFVNEKLAAHYGIQGVQGNEFRRVSLAGLPRAGLLTQASILTATSNPTRTSPVKRGRWVLEQLLGDPPPPPPPDVPKLKEGGDIEKSASLRVRMEQHRQDPNCAVCHQKMDTLGFGLENFDGIGKWRSHDGDFLIESTGELPDGSKFNGPKELVQWLRGNGDSFRRSLAENLLTYALGRALEEQEQCVVDEICKQTKQAGDRLSAMVVGIVESDPFQYRKLGEDNE